MEKTIVDRSLINKIDDIIERHDFDKHNLLTILQEAQSLIPNHYIPEAAATEQ